MAEFLGLSYNEKRPEYIGKPLELYAKVADQTEQTYKQNRLADTALDIVSKNTQVLPGADFIKKAALSDIDNKLKTIRDTGDYLHSGYMIDDAAKDFATNQALNAAKTDYAQRMAHIEEISKSDLPEEDKRKALALADRMYQEKMGTFAKEYETTKDLSGFRGAYSKYTPNKYYDPHKLVKDIIGTPYKDEQTGAINLGHDVDAGILKKNGFQLKYASEAELQRDIIRFLNTNREFTLGAESQNLMDTYGKQYDSNEIQQLVKNYTRQHNIKPVIVDGKIAVDNYGRPKYNIESTVDPVKDFEQDLQKTYNDFVQQLATKAGKTVVEDNNKFLSFEGLDENTRKQIENESYRILDQKARDARRINAAAEVGAGVYGFNALTPDVSQSHYGTSGLSDRATKVLENLVLPTTSSYTVDNHGVSRTWQHGFLTPTTTVTGDKGNVITNIANQLKAAIVTNADQLKVVSKFGDIDSKGQKLQPKHEGLGSWIKNMADKGFLYSEVELGVDKYDATKYNENLNELIEDYSDENGVNPTGKDLKVLQDAAKELSRAEGDVKGNPSYKGTLTTSSINLNKAKVNLGYTADPISGDIVNNVELYDNKDNRIYYKDLDYNNNPTGTMKSSILITDTNPEDTRVRAKEIMEGLINQASDAVRYSNKLGRRITPERYVNMISPALDIQGQLGGKDAIPKIHRTQTELIKEYNKSTDKSKNIKDFNTRIYVDLSTLLKQNASSGISNPNNLPVQVFADESVVLLNNMNEPLGTYANYSEMLRTLGANKLSVEYPDLQPIIQNIK